MTTHQGRVRTVGSIMATSVVAAMLAAGASAATAGELPVQPGPDHTLTPDARAAERLQVGFNGRSEQIEMIDHFYTPDGDHGPRLCQYYTGWDTAVLTDGEPDHPSGLAANIAWLETAQASGCDEVLISFKALSSADPDDEFDPVPPTVAEYQAAFVDYLDTDWAGLAGYTGDFAFAAWNEPNLNATSGNGYPAPAPGADSVIGPRLAAQYYLAATSVCASRGCTVAAVNFGSNGGRWVDYLTNCKMAAVPREEHCDEPSEHNTTGLPPSYLDEYRNEIANAAADFGLPADFRPDVVAYHGWSDTNAYLTGVRTCTGYDDCLLERVLYAFRGSWSGAEIWNTEDGVGQPGFFTHEEITDDVQVEAMEYLLGLAESTPRYTRLYYTHLIGSPSRLLLTDGDRPQVRPAMGLLQAAAAAESAED